MRKQFKIKLLLCLIIYSCNGQEPSNSYQFSGFPSKKMETKIVDLEFKKFLDSFFYLPLPVNHNLWFRKDTPLTLPQKTEKRSFKIPTTDLKKYLGLEKEDLSYKYYNTDDALETEVKKKWYSGQAFLVGEKQIGLIVYNAYYTTDPVGSQTILYILNTKGEMQDSMILEGSINAHGTYDSFILLNSNRFKTFRYTINEPNTKKIEYAFEDFYVEYKDENGYRSKCVVTDYKILEDGKIQKIKTSDPILLKEDAWKYTDSSLAVFEDDPMNRDWKQYLETGNE